MSVALTRNMHPPITTFLNVFAVTVTWHSNDQDLVLRCSVPGGYTCLAVARSDSDFHIKGKIATGVRGGGVADIFLHAPCISDHSLIKGRRLPVQPMTVPDLISVRTWSKFDEKAFQQDLLSIKLFSKDADLSEHTIKDLFSNYASTSSVFWTDIHQ